MHVLNCLFGVQFSYIMRYMKHVENYCKIAQLKIKKSISKKKKNYPRKWIQIFIERMYVHIISQGAHMRDNTLFTVLHAYNYTERMHGFTYIFCNFTYNFMVCSHNFTFTFYIDHRANVCSCFKNKVLTMHCQNLARVPFKLNIKMLPGTSLIIWQTYVARDQGG
jgi:hypothetical protein